MYIIYLICMTQNDDDDMFTKQRRQLGLMITMSMIMVIELDIILKYDVSLRSSNREKRI